MRSQKKQNKKKIDKSVNNNKFIFIETVLRFKLFDIWALISPLVGEFKTL